MKIMLLFVKIVQALIACFHVRYIKKRRLGKQKHFRSVPATRRCTSLTWDHFHQTHSCDFRDRCWQKQTGELTSPRNITSSSNPRPVMVWRGRLEWMHSGDRARQIGPARARGRTCGQVSDGTDRRPLDRLRSFIRTLRRLPVSLLRALLLLLLCLTRPIRRAMAASAKDRGSEGCEETGERIRNYHKQAFEFISVALQIDEDEKGICLHYCYASEMCKYLTFIRKKNIN